MLAQKSFFEGFRTAITDAFGNDCTIKPLEGDEPPPVRETGKVSPSSIMNKEHRIGENGGGVGMWGGVGRRPAA
jgi:hypothetical protein